MQEVFTKAQTAPHLEDVIPLIPVSVRTSQSLEKNHTHLWHNSSLKWF